MGLAEPFLHGLNFCRCLAFSHGGVVGVSSAPSVCEILQLTGEGGGEVLTGEKNDFPLLAGTRFHCWSFDIGFPC